jgi:4-hydroxy-3-methylbut-2-en-1-yl diphosphate reductase
MTVILASEYGFCDGVRNALTKLDEVMASQKGEKIYSIGEIIHNDDVIARYRAAGVETVESIWDAADGVGVVRAHGLPDSVIANALGKGLRIIDATCPFVRLISRIVKKEIGAGNMIYLVGEPGHPEVIAATSDFGDAVTVIDHANFDPDSFDFVKERIVLLSQTTMAEEAFLRIAGEFIKRHHVVTVYNTICTSTRNHQRAAVETAKRVEAMIVLGGKKSSNTKRLAELCAAIVPTYHLERIGDLDPSRLKGLGAVGLTAGASTPDDLVREALEELEGL